MRSQPSLKEFWDDGDLVALLRHLRGDGGGLRVLGFGGGLGARVAPHVFQAVLDYFGDQARGEGGAEREPDRDAGCLVLREFPYCFAHLVGDWVERHVFFPAREVHEVFAVELESAHVVPDGLGGSFGNRLPDALPECLEGLLGRFGERADVLLDGLLRLGCHFGNDVSTPSSWCGDCCALEAQAPPFM